MVKLKRAAAFGLSARKMEEVDLAFLAALYASTRSEELAASGWPEAMQRAFLAQQHDAQYRHYRSAFATADWLILEQGGRAVGRLVLDAGTEAVRVIDISLLPEARGRGLGTAVLRDVIDAARKDGRGVALSVRNGNPARRLYERLGFAAVAGLDAAYQDMTRNP